MRSARMKAREYTPVYTDDKPDCYIEKPAPREKNKGKKTYGRWLQSTLFPLWWATYEPRQIGGAFKQDGCEFVHIACKRCGEPGMLVRDANGFYSTRVICVGHLSGRGRAPELKMDISNVEPQCNGSKCNGSLDRGMKRLDNETDKE